MKLEGYDVIPCLFCGSEDLRLELSSGFLSTNWRFVICNNINCQATGPQDLGVSGAIDGWNTRAVIEKQRGAG